MKKQSKCAIAAFVILSAFAVTACEGQSSRNIVIADSFTPDEEDSIIGAIDEWNRVSREYLGYDLIIYAGRHVDENGFDPLEDLGDSYNMIYRFTEPDKFYDCLVANWSENGGIYSMFGYGMQNDILIFNFNLHKIIEQTWDNPDIQPKEYLRMLQVAVLHEFGHWLGLKHTREVDDYWPIMYPTTNILTEPVLTEKDIQAFCLVYDCVK